MKKLMLVLAIAGLMVGCARNRGGTEDQNQMNTGSSSSAPVNSTTNYVNTNAAPQQ